MNEQVTPQVFSKTVIIKAPPSRVWTVLTEPGLMKKWMSEMELDIVTDWKVGEPVVIRGYLYKKPFENIGRVISFMPERLLEYTHRSSLSRLPEVPASYTLLSFSLAPIAAGTELALAISNFPTETIYKHLAFYWNVTLELLKKYIEQQEAE